MQASLPSPPPGCLIHFEEQRLSLPICSIWQPVGRNIQSSEFHQSSWAFEKKRTNRSPYLFEGREAFFPGEARLRCGTSSLHPPCWEEIFGTLSVKGETVTQAPRCTRKEKAGCLCHRDASSAAVQSREAELAANFEEEVA